MVRPSTCLILSTVFLLGQLSYLAEAKTFCTDDYTRSACWMCKGSELRDCWDDAIDKIDKLEITDNLQKSAKKYCKGYGKLAKCWQSGRCCSEFSPLLAAATNICNLKTWPENMIIKDKLENVIQTAYGVRNTIWHNDSGLNVPKLSVSVKAYGSGSDESDQSDSYSSQSKSHTENHNEHTESTKSSSSYYQKSADPSTEHTESPKKVDPSSYINQKKTAVTHSFQPQLESRVPESHYEPEHYTQPKKKADPSLTKVHHHAKCSSKPKKCQAQTAQQYHNARSKHTHRSISKRAKNPLHKRAPSYHDIQPNLFKRSNNGDIICGLDFQGVPYPKEIPETVAHIFAEL
ncbi:hypothetical protein PCANC_28741 [Puccinia coronata f. sp. avenae]|uniref:Uncharacterized protein n=1 Tax=Puccinia coronata f. sp. avenae TaxID=200324 RepID=A0A2N5TEY3_9BASI|nr:hypothetical protein PCASD_22432 [Puccinia coronata f. sp. avenae]PLW23999.1 hypothetical protein PCANC_28741 [Puccinia coronata f. sp. avenae]